MAALSDYAEQRILDFMINGNADLSWTSPTSVYLALFTTATTDAGGGTEVSGGSYARVTLTQAFDTMSAVTNGATANTAEIAFAGSTAAWGTITHIALFDASTGGNMLVHGALDSSVVMLSGDTFKIAAGDLDIVIA